MGTYTVRVTKSYEVNVACTSEEEAKKQAKSEGYQKVAKVKARAKVINYYGI